MLLDTRDVTVGSLFGAVILISIAEMFFSYFQDKKLYTRRDTRTNMYLMGFAFLLNLATKTGTFFLLDYCYRFRLFEIHHLYLYWFALVFIQDLLYWVLHCSGHYIRFFWAMHVTHHSSTHFNITTGFRSTVFEPIYRVFFYLPLAFMGFSALDILFAYLVTQIYGNLVHTQTIGKLHPWIEYIFVTPSHHRVHHASNIRYLDKNMGMVLIIWDRLFGTFQEELPEGKEQIIYGLTTQREDESAVQTVFHEFIALSSAVKTAPGWKNKIKYVIYPPGWSHDGSSCTAKVLQRELWAIENKK